MTARRTEGPSLAARARWLLRAKPADHMLALSECAASLPVIGKHFEPLGSMTAMSIWGLRHLPDFVAASAKSRLAPGAAAMRREEREQTTAAAVAALRNVVPPAELAAEWPAPQNLPPLWNVLEHRRSV